MYRALNSKLYVDTVDWRPTASVESLRLRAQMLTNIRRFFAERNIWEVETPLLSQHTVTDTHIESFKTVYRKNGISQHYYLQTSPEYAMKRLLAAGSGAIYQICKAFRNAENSGRHNPEFSILEWYRPNFNHHQLMSEVEELIADILKTPTAKRISYSELFQRHLKIDPHLVSIDTLQQLCRDNVNLSQSTLTTIEKDDCLDLLMSHIIEPTLGFNQPIFIYDYPASQAALSVIRHEHPPVAERFELYIQGIELANGFNELTNAKEQIQRFQHNLIQRKQQNYPTVEIDPYLIAALQHGLPPCAGVALGLDRLFMLALGVKNIQKTLTFCWDKA